QLEPAVGNDRHPELLPESAGVLLVPELVPPADAEEPPEEHPGPQVEQGRAGGGLEAEVASRIGEHPHLLEREAARVLLRVDEAEAVGDVQVVDAQLLEPPPVLQGLSQTVAEPVVPQRP